MKDTFISQSERMHKEANRKLTFMITDIQEEYCQFVLYGCETLSLPLKEESK
jgi:hypothetical protein